MPQVFMNHNYHRRYGTIANANTPIDEVWATVQTINAIREDYEGQAQIYNWPADQAKFELSPHLAYWLARHVIMDHWPAAESFIQKDEAAWKSYTNYKEMCRSLGIINYSVDGSPDFHVDNNGQIVGWKDGRKPIKKEKVRTPETPEEDLDAIADRIAERVAVFRKQRKLRKISQEEDDES